MMHIQQRNETTMPTTSHVYSFSSVEHIQIPTENQIKSFYGQVNCLPLEYSHFYFLYYKFMQHEIKLLISCQILDESGPKF
jgi:hypothetical protein